MLTEVWKDIDGYEGSYQVSNMGRVRSVDRVVTFSDGSVRKYKGKVRKLSLDAKGYEQVTLSNGNRYNTKRVHRLVLETFKPHVNMKDLQVNHMDGNKLNNHLTNLEWVTGRDNILHAYDTGLITNIGEGSPNAILSNADVLEILQRLDAGESQRNIALDYGVGQRYISYVNTGGRWRSVKEEYERTKKTIPR